MDTTTGEVKYCGKKDERLEANVKIL